MVLDFTGFFLPGSSPQTGGSKSIRGPDASVQIVCLQHKPSFLLYSVLARWLFFFLGVPVCLVQCVCGIQTIATAGLAQINRT